MVNEKYTTAIYKDEKEYQELSGFADSIGVRHHHILKEKRSRIDPALLQDSIFNLVVNLSKDRDLLVENSTFKQLSKEMLSSLSLEELYRLECRLIEAHKEGKKESNIESCELLGEISMTYFTLGSFCYYYLQEERKTNVPEYRIFTGYNSHKKDSLYGVLIASEIEKFGYPQ